MFAVLGHRDEIAGSGLRPNVIAEQRLSKYELSELQHVILLQRRRSSRAYQRYKQLTVKKINPQHEQIFLWYP